MKHIHGGNVYERSCELDFSANINPLGIPSGVVEAACEGVRRSTAYPDPDQTALRRAVACRHQVLPEQVICGNGAAELIFMLCDAMQPQKALLVAPGFAEYEAALEKTGCRITFYPCTEETGFSLCDDYLTFLTGETDIAFLCSPNNPTGVMVPADLLVKIAHRCREKGILLVMDECFVPLTDAGETNSLIPLIRDNPCLFVLRAFTKLYGIAGLRLGYGICSDLQLLERMKETVQPWNVSLPAQMAGVAALQEHDFEARSREYVSAQRAYLLKGLKKLGLTFFDPGANFIFLKGPEDLGEACAARGILIRDCSNYKGLKKGYWRIAVRTREENDRLLACLEEIVWQDRS